MDLHTKFFAKCNLNSLFLFFFLYKCKHKILCKISPLLIGSSLGLKKKKKVENLIFNKLPDGAQIWKL